MEMETCNGNIETRRHGDMENGDMENGDMEIWRHGDMNTWRQRDMENGGDMETRRHGDMETWRPGHGIIKEKQDREAQVIFLNPLCLLIIQTEVCCLSIC
jgi:hypothetical protein